MSPDVVVIGAGFAGLSAATALVESGARVLVLEARPGLGGRASAYRDPATGEPVDNGQHVLFGCYTETLAFLRRVGALRGLSKDDGLVVSLIDRDGVQSELSLPPLPAPLNLLAGVMAWDAVSWRERLSLLRIGSTLQAAARNLARGRPAGADGSSETVREWLARHGQAPRLVELFWEPLALAALNQPIGEAAAAPFLAVVARMFASAEAAAILLPAVPLADLYAEPARRWLEARGAIVRTQARARVAIENGRVVGVVVRGERIETRTVVAAVPWFAMSELFEDPPAALAPLLSAAAATPGSPIVTVNLWFDRPVTPGPLIGLPGRTFQWVFDKRLVFGDTARHLSLVSSGAESIVRLSNDDLVATALAEVRDAFEPARGARLVRATAVRERHATFSLAPGLPPRPETRTPVDGLLLAGDWIDTGLPATIESAVVSGHWAARAAQGASSGPPRS